MIAATPTCTADAGKTSASRQTFVSGNAARLAGGGAARDDPARLLAYAGAADAAIALAARSRRACATAASASARSISPTLAGRCATAIVLPRRAATSIRRRRRSTTTARASPYATYGFAAQIAEVEVDLELGTVQGARASYAAHDVGRAINPTLVEGQIHGGIAQGLGMALMEEYIPGRTDNLHDYLIPTVGDVPPIETYLIEDAEPLGPFGAKGVGEPALIATAPAILNAIRHATGVRITPRAGDARPRARGDPRPHEHEREPSRRLRARAAALAGGDERASRRQGRACDACPVLCRIRPGQAGACDRYGNVDGVLDAHRPAACWSAHAGARAARWRRSLATRTGTATPLADARDVFVTGVGAGTTYPDYKPAPFIVSSTHDGVDMVTVVTEGIFSYCGVKVKIDTDRHLGPETGDGARARASRSATSPPPSTARRCCRSAACTT